MMYVNFEHISNFFLLFLLLTLNRLMLAGFENLQNGCQVDLYLVQKKQNNQSRDNFYLIIKYYAQFSMKPGKVKAHTNKVKNLFNCHQEVFRKIPKLNNSKNFSEKSAASETLVKTRFRSGRFSHFHTIYFGILVSSRFISSSVFILFRSSTKRRWVKMQLGIIWCTASINQAL